MNSAITNLLSELLVRGKKFTLVVPDASDTPTVAADIATALSGAGIVPVAVDDLTTSARYVFFQVQGAAVKVTFDGSTASGANNIELVLGQEPTWRMNNFLKARFSGNGGAAVLVCYVLVRG